MINWTLYKYEMKGSVRMLLIFAAVMTLYVTVIIQMYDPQLMATLDGFVKLMPQLMAAVGMSAGATSLLGFMISYLYGFVLLIFPMVYCILRGNGLIAKYIDRGSMAALAAAPVKRRRIALTQAAVLLSGISILIVYVTGLEMVIAQSSFPGKLMFSDLLKINAGLLCLHFCIGGVCFLASCVCSDTKYSIGFGAGIPVLMYVLQMLANMGEQAEKAGYFSLFTLFDPSGIIAGEMSAAAGAAVLLAGAAALFAAGILIFSKKDLCI